MPRRAIIFRILQGTSYQVTIGNMGSIGAVEHKGGPRPCLGIDHLDVPGRSGPGSILQMTRPVIEADVGFAGMIQRKGDVIGIHPHRLDLPC